MLDWARLHAALNDLPAALLLASVLFDLLGSATRRESLRAAGFWTLLAGVAGGALAAASGLFAEREVAHAEAAHAIMQTHKTLSVIVLVMFGGLALWRLARRGVLRERERPVALTASVIAVALMVYAARLGGALVFEHGAGIPTARIQAIQGERDAESVPHEHGPPAPGDSATAPADSAKGTTHTHDDGTEHTHQADTAKQ
jgi:uncharacterized membrane protein